jgi:hypothetical protein
MARRASGSLALCYLPCPCAAPVVPYRSDAEHPTQRLARSGDPLRGGHLRYPARRTLAWRRASRTAGPSTSGGRFVCRLVGSHSKPQVRAISPLPCLPAAGRAQLVQRTAQRRGGIPVKCWGWVMFYFREAGAGVAACLEMLQGLTDAGLPHPCRAPHQTRRVPRRGLLRSDRERCGQDHRLRPARRGPGQHAVVEASEEGASFREIGPVELKGVSGVVRSIPPIRRTAR